MRPLASWMRVAAVLQPNARAERYALWRDQKIMPDAWIAEIEKAFPPSEKVTNYRKEDGVGLGDLVKKVTDFLGIKQCGGCKKRQEAWNKIRL